MRTYRSPDTGDGIGQEVVPEGVRVLDQAGRRFGIRSKGAVLGLRVSARTGRDEPAPYFDESASLMPYISVRGLHRRYRIHFALGVLLIRRQFHNT